MGHDCLFVSKEKKERVKERRKGGRKEGLKERKNTSCDEEQN